MPARLWTVLSFASFLWAADVLLMSRNYVLMVVALSRERF